ncbi:phosphatidylinositol 5-phosphate 4-kinase type-2 alpha isoform X1 [Erpetoichthys calabaricus]|uniref:phosphatidylinositol 5-phosphate 4-kinase type-2 alpha isoform X1 n=1 Tax=Erpetoichthys calabaricus TaxID=27687 RepID=UPI00109EFDC0|nr:phosphatidylinositol 5-phosphate 4-kinase type-2 alpha isoform X1 [Erpetoichthys calabaricus]
MATASSIAASLASKTKTKKKHFVAQKVKLFRASDPLISVLMWGVNHSINELSHVQVPVMLMPDDFKAYSKIKVDNHLFNKENMPSHFKFKEYCPTVFRNLRERFAIDDQDYQNSLTRSAPFTNDSQGRSGARFHTTYDKRYVIKTITSEDVAEMHNILKKYHQFIVECHGNTLLPQFLGMYRLTVDGVETYMIVTRNVFSHRLSVCRKYDLKGSTVAREASDKEKHRFQDESSKLRHRLQTVKTATRFYSSIKNAKELPTFKDNDFINDGQKIYIDENNKKMFCEKLRKDVEFLAQMKLMDYSLLVGIHDVEKAEQEEVELEENDGEEDAESDGTHPVGTPPDSPGNTLSSSKPLLPGEFDPTIDVYAIKSHENAPRKEVYFMAIIDILTHYDAKKKAAHAAKTVKHGAGAEISTVNPEQYSKRFYDFIANILT